MKYMINQTLCLL